MYKQYRISIIIPAYNAERTIREVSMTLPGWIDQILIVNDQSNDKTLNVVQSLKAEQERIEVIDLHKNLGVGGAMKRGYQEALAQDADIVIKMDSDGQMDPAYLPQLLAPIISGNARCFSPSILKRMLRSVSS